MKITLISPFPDIVAVGPRILSSCLKKAGHQVQILFLLSPWMEFDRNKSWTKYSPAALQEAAELSKDSGLIGISVMTNLFENAIDITNQIRKTSRAPIIWGGTHATLRPEECLDHADLVCVGEGESSLVELARKLADGRDFRNVKNIYFKERGKVTQNQLQPLNSDLDSIPFPDYDFEDHFILNEGKIERADLKLMEKYLGHEYMFIATRGCPRHCAYCANNALQKIDKSYALVRKRSPENLIQELIAAKKKLPFIRSVNCPDDAFFWFPEKKIQEFCEGYSKHIKLPLCIRGLHPEACNRTKLAMLADAGLKSLRMGLESFSERTLAFYERKVPKEKMLAAVEMINEFRGKIDQVQYDILLDNPWETNDDLTETLMTLVRFKPPFTLALFSMTFYPGTALYEKAKKEGLIKDELNDVYRKYFRARRKTYFNGLFNLLDTYAHRNQQLPPSLMLVLTSCWGRRLGISYFLYFLLLLEIKSHRFFQLVSKGLNDLARGDLMRLTRWMEKTFKF